MTRMTRMGRIFQVGRPGTEGRKWTNGTKRTKATKGTKKRWKGQGNEPWRVLARGPADPAVTPLMTQLRLGRLDAHGTVIGVLT